ncbi:MAG: hypothetical protein AAGD22_05040 [Verrucomicrobiota bacterium]
MTLRWTSCDRLVRRMVSWGEARGVYGRWGMGVYLLGKAYGGYKAGEKTRELPVDGIKEELVAHGQAGQFYRHLHFHIGCRFLGWPGWWASWFMNQVDERQALTGRGESAVEVKDNEAAWACAEVLKERSQRRLTRREAGEKLREIVAS